MLYCTLDSVAAIATPAKGTGPGTAVPVDDFHGGKCGLGIMIEQPNEHVAFPLGGNINFTKGTLDFWYVPSSAETDGKTHNLFATSGFFLAGEGGIKVRKADSSNANEFTVYIKDPAGVTHKTAVPESAYSFTPNVPVRVTVAWNLTGPTGSPAVWIFFDKVEVPSYQPRALLPITAPILNANAGYIYIGAESALDATPAMGLMDDFKIYAASLPPK